MYKDHLSEVLQINMHVCEKHQGETITNFCASTVCLKGLCPQCIQDHYQYHKKNKIQAQIYSIKSFRSICKNKLSNILQQIKRFTTKKNKYNEGTTFQLLQQLQKHEKQCLQVIHNYFNELKNQVQQHTEQDLEIFANQMSEFNRMAILEKQIKLIFSKFQDPKYFNLYAKTIVQLDTAKILDKINKVSKFQLCRNSFKIKFNDCKQKLKQILQNSIFVQNQQHLSHPSINSSLDDSYQKQYSQPTSKLKKFEQSFGNQNNEEQDILVIRSKQIQKQQINGNRKYVRNNSIKNLFEDQPTKKRTISTYGISGKLISQKYNSFKKKPFYLHFFHNYDLFLQILELDQPKKHFFVQNINCAFQVPEFHKSISTDNGNLYLIGGTTSKTFIKSTKIFKYNFQSHNLTVVANMIHGRSSHSVCLNGNYIYILGGITNQTVTNLCERFNTLTLKVQEIAPMCQAVCSFSCCSFNNKRIYRFGGMTANQSNSQTIQCFEEKVGKWKIINPLSITPIKQLLMSTSAAIQINSEEIMIMGGYNAANQGQNLTYFLKINQLGEQSIVDINIYPLNYSEGFWNNNPIIYNCKVYALQNIPDGNQCLENQRRVIEFNGTDWKSINR